MNIRLGSKMKDKITGFEGVVTGYCKYLTGCHQALLVPPVDDDGKMIDGHWCDEQRLEAVGDTVITLDNSQTPGPDIAPPRRT